MLHTLTDFVAIARRNMLINEAGGGVAGSMELVSTSLADAKAHATKLYEKHGRSLDEEIPEFDKNYKYAQKLASYGKTKRKDMPVIDTADVREFQDRLKKGYIDWKKPFSHKFGTNPFPEGLTDEKARLWLEAGLKQHDKNKKDDQVKVKMKSVAVGDLKPIQQQIYYDKSIKATAASGREKTTEFLTKKSIYIASADNFIIDGHHRFLSGVLLDPSMKVKVLSIDLPIKTLLPLSLSYGDAIGNKRNA